MDQFEGTLDEGAHFARFLGDAEPQVRPLGPGVESLVYADVEHGLVHCATSGVSRLAIRALHPTELLCTVRAEQVEAALFLLQTIVRLTVQRAATLVVGNVMENETPLLRGTEIHGVLLTTALWFEGIDLAEDADGTTLHVITVLPVTPAELAFIEQFGTDSFAQRINTCDADLSDITRESIVAG